MPILKSEVTPVPALPAPEVVPVPELGGEVVVRPMLLSDRLRLMRLRDGRPKDYAHIAELLACAVVDANGEELFSAEDWEAWGRIHTGAAVRLWDVAYKLSGLSSEDAEKNSPAVQNSSTQ